MKLMDRDWTWFAGKPDETTIAELHKEGFRYTAKDHKVGEHVCHWFLAPKCKFKVAKRALPARRIPGTALSVPVQQHKPERMDFAILRNRKPGVKQTPHPLDELLAL
jgi:hypothetical protein